MNRKEIIDMTAQRYEIVMAKFWTGQGFYEKIRKILRIWWWKHKISFFDA